MKKFSKILALLIAAVMIFSLAACQTKPTEPVKPDETTAAPTTAKPDETTPAPETEPPVTEPEYKDEPFADNLPTAPTTTTPLVVAYSPFSAKFSPYFADTAYDQDVVGMTQLGLMTTDRMGGIIYNAIEGETVRYNGTDYEYKGTSNISVDFDEAANQTTYTARLRVGMKFSDGVEVTADDIIFTYYTLLDPSYTGSTTLSSYKIIGLKNYQTQTSDEVYEKYTKMVDEMYKAGHKNYQANDLYTEELYNAYWEKMDGRGLEATQAIVDYCMANYNSDKAVQKYVNPELTAEDVSANEGLQVALGMGAWGFGKPTEDGQFKDVLGNVYDLKETFPTVENYYEAIYGNYEGDLVTAWDTEKAVDTDATIPADTNAWFILEYGSKDAAMGGQGVPNIAGIKKLTKRRPSTPSLASLSPRCTTMAIPPSMTTRTTSSVSTSTICPCRRARSRSLSAAAPTSSSLMRTRSLPSKPTRTTIVAARRSRKSSSRKPSLTKSRRLFPPAMSMLVK